ncbi:MAG TPA: SelB C-terminal domain-containing protein, partial [Actinomycetota bacterium]|nr:SelB C-terminal domain-containing protein [Actinomycetota bacterium]
EAVAALAAHHRDRPLERGMGREALRAALGVEPDELDDLLAAHDEVAAEGPLVRLTSHRVRLGGEQAAERARVLAAVEAGGFTPPLAGELGADPPLLRALVEAGDLVPIANFYLTRGSAARARAEVRAAIEASGPLTVAQIRDLLGTSRKYAVPLCEWLDATGATRRQGDVRVLGPDA